jgi:DNA polymerase theta
VQVLLQPQVFSGRNVVYSAPTSGGKSLVAEILALRRMVNTQKAILLVLPFVAFCNETASHWEKLLSPLGTSVARYYGGQGWVLPKLPEKTGIAACTIEKANAIVNAMTEAGTLASSFSSVVVDELHMVRDEDLYELHMVHDEGTCWSYC